MLKMVLTPPGSFTTQGILVLRTLAIDGSRHAFYTFSDLVSKFAALRMYHLRTENLHVNCKQWTNIWT